MPLGNFKILPLNITDNSCIGGDRKPTVIRLLMKEDLGRDLGKIVYALSKYVSCLNNITHYSTSTKLYLISFSYMALLSGLIFM